MTKKLFLFLSVTLILCCTSKSVSKEKGHIPEKLFNHTLLYKFSESVTRDDKNKFLFLFEGLPNKIELLEKVEISNIETSSTAFDVIVTLRFKKIEGLGYYQNHPDHDSINALGEKIISDYAYFRYWD